MAIPLILVETVAITELYILYARSDGGAVRALNRWAGILAGVCFAGVAAYLMATAIVPITQAGAWRGWIDVVAVGSYILGVVPFAGIALLEFGLIGRGLDRMAKLGVHAALVGVFLAVGHVAMIFGMLDPSLSAAGAHAGHMGH